MDEPVSTRSRLTDRQHRYIEARAAGKSQVESALIAGISPASARRLATRWDHDPQIQEAIADAQQLAGQEARVTPADLLRQLAIIAFSSVEDYVITDDGVWPAEDAPAYVMQAVQSVKRRTRRVKEGDEWIDQTTVELKLWDKTAALKMLGEHFGMWIKRIRIEDDEEAKAALSKLREIMADAEARRRSESAEEAAIAAFQTKQLAAAGEVVVGSGQPLEAIRHLAERVSDADPD